MTPSKRLVIIEASPTWPSFWVELVVKYLPPSAGKLERCEFNPRVPLEEGMATHSCILAWRIPWTEEPSRLQSMESQSWAWLKRLSSTTHLITVGLEHLCRSAPRNLGGEFWLSPRAPLFQCTVSCGGGFQKRTVHCVASENNKTEGQDRCLCDHEPRPPEFQKCNPQACRKNAGRWMALLRGA